MLNHRAKLIAATAAAAGAMLLTACNGDDTGAAGTVAPSAAESSGHPHTGAPAADVIGAYDPVDRSDAVFFASVLNGANEVPTKGGPAVGDKDGHAIALMRVQGDEVSFAFTWKGTGTPTAGHIHQGGAGTNGDVKIPFFTEKLPGGGDSVYGTVKVTDAALLKSLKADPGQFYFNLHTAEFPGGAVRGQVHRLPVPMSLPDAFRGNSLHSVVTGAQIYACTKQPGGDWKFTQDNVKATLDGNIAHTFQKSGPTGPPQWIAPDHSAVTGKVLHKIPNGEGNIPELVLAASQSGTSGGEFSATKLVLRLNTEGGVAPAGTCDPATQPEASVPYKADYLFLSGK
ncbi:CHRD domain-containing protein [Streptomyces sp. NPDC087420]|uniref:CHRD domain-containing protein n=1 Tax=Streptomyces sp. NPDC087420 TaxID=3365785 RepID=UPI00383526FA